MEEKTVSIKVSVSLEDYLALQNQQIKKLRIGLSIFIPLVYFLILSKSLDPTSPFSVAVLICTTILLLAAMLFYLPVRLKKIWKQQYNNNKILQKEHYYIISTGGLKTSSEIATAQFGWSDLHAFRETKDAFNIFTSENQLLYLPKKSFEAENDISFVRECLSNLPVYKRKRQPFGCLNILVIILGCLFLFSAVYLLLLGR